jgi:hypothetical protein
MSIFCVFLKKVKGLNIKEGNEVKSTMAKINGENLA